MFFGQEIQIYSYLILMFCTNFTQFILLLNSSPKLPDYLVAVLFTGAVIGRLLVVIGGGITFLNQVGNWPGVVSPGGKTLITANCLTRSEPMLGFKCA